MDLKILLSWLALNAGLLAAIVLIIVGWKRTRALTGPELAKKLDKVTDADPQKPDFTLGEIAFLLRETGRPPEERLLAAVFTSWQAGGLIRCEMAPKKRLSGYGDDMQPTLSFPGFEASLPGAEGALFTLLLDAVDSSTLQASESYDWARANAARLRDCLLRYEAEGRAKLRAEGAIRTETQKQLFGTTGREQLVYTPRGLRRAQALRRWENHLRTAPEDAPEQAVLFGYAAPPPPLSMLCERAVQGYRAGLAMR